ncbi:MAG: type II toxin-antitoxin system Phd/YefM family antitoxin [Actinomycetota bacterium]|nr:type II toxin-antitoxin system Phd/YefM family antitoxin [Actinomycetota bacterium]
MSKIIGVTEARSKLRKILDDISKEREPYVLTRGSKPEAVIIPYEEYLAIEERAKKLWNERFELALKKSRALFNEWLRKRGYDPEKLTEEEVERIIRSA